MDPVWSLFDDFEQALDPRERHERGAHFTREADIARVPVGNLRVPRAEFGAVWAAAERRCVELGQRGITGDWYPAAVVMTWRGWPPRWSARRLGDHSRPGRR